MRSSPSKSRMPTPAPVISSVHISPSRPLAWTKRTPASAAISTKRGSLHASGPVHSAHANSQGAKEDRLNAYSPTGWISSAVSSDMVSPVCP